MEFTIRSITEDDWESYRDIRLEMLADTPMAYSETRESALAKNESVWRERLAGSTGIASDTSVRFTAILPDGRWIGSMGAYLDGQAGPVLVGVYVAPQYRGDAFGVTSALLDAIEAWAEAHAPSIRLDVHEANARAIASYAKRGYVATGNSIPYPIDPTQLEFEMVKRLR